MASTYVDDPRDVAFERLYARYDRDVYRYVLAVLRNPAEAEDVTQTTFLNAYRAIQAGEEPQMPHNWLIAIAHNACRSRVRFAMRRPKEVPLDDVVEQLTVPEADRTNVRELLRALGRLPFNQRSAITMRELEGRSYPEIADTLGVSVAAVEALISRARKTLRLQAAALRGLTVVQLPRSLRRLFENGDASGVAVAAKAAAVIVAGVVAGGIGYTAAGGAPSPHGSVVPRLQPRGQAPAPAHARHRGAAPVHHGSSAPTKPLAVRRHAAAAIGQTMSQLVPPVASIAPATPAPAAAPPAPAARAAAPAAAPARRRPVTDTVKKTVQTAVAAVPPDVPEAQLPDVPLPDVPVPDVQLPQLPQLPPPAVPPAPELPGPPLP